MSEWKPDASFDEAASINVSGRPSIDFDVHQSGFRYCCRFKVEPKSDFLHVSLSAFAWEPGRPYFPRTSRDMRGNLLEIFDPTLMMFPDLRVAAFIGTHDKDAISGLLEIVSRIATQIAVDHRRIVFWGSSGAAHGAVMAAIRIGRDGNAIVSNGLLELFDFSSKQLSRSWTDVFGDGSFDKILTKYPRRLSVAMALKIAVEKSELPKLLVLQNTTDAMFHDQQFIPFCQRLEKIGVQSDRIRVGRYTNASGHAIETPDLLGEILDGDFPIGFFRRDDEKFLKNLLRAGVGADVPLSGDLQAALVLAKAFINRPHS